MNRNPNQPPAQPLQPQPVDQAETPQPVSYGQHLVDRGPTGPTKEKTRKRLKVPAMVSLLYSSFFALSLFGGLASSVFGFIGTSNRLEEERTTLDFGDDGDGKGARGKLRAQQKKELREQKEQEFQTKQRILISSFGANMIMITAALTGQVAGIVSAINMLKLQSFRWAFWSNIFAAIPFITSFYLVVYFAVASLDAVPGGAIILILFIGSAITDGGRFLISVIVFVCLLMPYTKKFFDRK